MKIIRAQIPLLLLSPAAALAVEAGGKGESFSFVAGLLQMFAALAIVVGIILLFYYISNRWLKKAGGTGRGERHIRLVETKYLAPKKSLVLVEVGGEYLLLSNCGDRLDFVKQIDILEEIEVVEDLGETSRRPGLLAEKLGSLLARISGRWNRPATIEASGPITVSEAISRDSLGRKQPAGVVSFSEALQERERKIVTLDQFRMNGTER